MFREYSLCVPSALQCSGHPGNIYPADTDVFKTSSGFVTSWRRLVCDVLKTSWRRWIYVFLETSDLRRLEDVWFMTSWRRRIYVFLKTSDLRCLEDVCFTASWRRLIYDVLKTSVERHLCSNIVATSTLRQNKWFFLILYCLKYSESFKCFCLSWYLGIKFCKLLRFFNQTCKQILQNH